MIGDGLKTRLPGPRRAHETSRGEGGADDRTAVIDIGSNTVRLVIYGGDPRAPEVLWNEKVTARLGRGLAETGALSRDSQDSALAALARFRAILSDLAIARVDTIATAAARDASNGPEFLAAIVSLGLPVRLLSGEEEARASAMGIVGAFPGAEGLVADIGGGSLELVRVADGACEPGHSLPLGTLRLPALRASKQLGRRATRLVQKTGLGRARTETLYMVGGTWRALALLAMQRRQYPLTDPHGFVLSAEEAAALAKWTCAAPVNRIEKVRGMRAMRAEKLPDAAALLNVLLKQLQPGRLVFSSWGLREGLLFEQLDTEERARDPLIAAVSGFAARHPRERVLPPVLARWAATPFASIAPEDEPLREAAAWLAPALHRVEPNRRAAQALEWALDKRWVGIDARGRALLAAALTGSMGVIALPERIASLAEPGELALFARYGQALRLGMRLGAGASLPLEESVLARSKRSLELRLEQRHAPLANGPVIKDLAALAAGLDLQPVVTALPTAA